MFQPQSHLYSRWLDSAFGAGAIPDESKATCTDCAMCKPGSGYSPDAEDEEFRFIRNGCCTYYPELPNFLVGQALTRTSGDGAEQALDVLRSRIRARVRCTPFGILPTEAAETVQSNPFVTIFGRDESYRCPFQRKVDGACTIWEHRNSICSTWFCKYERGDVSSRAWSAVKHLLSEVETTLASWCVQELFDDEVITRLFDKTGLPRHDVVAELSGGLEDEGYVPDDAARRLWGPWYGQEVEFFRTCADRVAALSWTDVRRVGGTRIAALERVANHALARVKQLEIPDRLRHVGLPGALIQIRTGDDGRALVYPGAFDVQHFDHALLDRLSVFDGDTSAVDVRARLNDEGVDLSEDTLRRLVDYGLLEAADAESRLPDTPLPLQQTDRLRVVPTAEFESQVDFDRSGAAVVKVNCGYKDIEFDESDLLEFGRQLARRRLGFTAGLCMQWSNGPTPLTWERVAPLLETLMHEGVLERIR